MSARTFNRGEMDAGRLTPGMVDELVEEGARVVQARHGLVVDGMAGPVTRARLIPSTLPPGPIVVGSWCLPIEGIAMPLEAGLLYGYSRVPDDPSTVRDESHEHQGVDLFAPEGTPIVAVGNGRVVLTQRDAAPKPANGVSAGGYGCQVIIRHDDGSYTRSSHMRKGSVPIEIVNGAMVSTGQKIGEVGRTYWAWTWRAATASKPAHHDWKDLFDVSNAHCHWEWLLRYPVPREMGRGDPLVFFRDRAVEYARRRKGPKGHLLAT